VLFELDSAVIQPGESGIEAVQTLLTELQKYPNDSVVLEGHTCSRGNPAYNMALGLRRAEAVREYLIQGGIDAERVEVVSFGDTKPVELDPRFVDHPYEDPVQRRVVFRYSMGRD